MSLAGRPGCKGDPHYNQNNKNDSPHPAEGLPLVHTANRIKAQRGYFTLPILQVRDWRLDNSVICPRTQCW